jgi:hypothetical protein
MAPALATSAQIRSGRGANQASNRFALSHQHHLRRPCQIPLQLRFPRQVLLRPFDFGKPELRRRVQRSGRIREMRPGERAQIRPPRGDDAVHVIGLEDIPHCVVGRAASAAQNGPGLEEVHFAKIGYWRGFPGNSALCGTCGRIVRAILQTPK